MGLLFLHSERVLFMKVIILPSNVFYRGHKETNLILSWIPQINMEPRPHRCLKMSGEKGAFCQKMATDLSYFTPCSFKSNTLLGSCCWIFEHVNLHAMTNIRVPDTLLAFESKIKVIMISSLPTSPGLSAGVFILCFWQQHVLSEYSGARSAYTEPDGCSIPLKS